MLSAGFCHLLADSLRNLPFSGRFPTATFLAALGYIITLVADQLVHLVADGSLGGGGKHDDG
jgi:zinc transporter 1/2/3